jgi:hypothetical protein
MHPLAGICSMRAAEFVACSNHQSQVVERGRDALVAGLGEKRAVGGTTTALNGPANREGQLRRIAGRCAAVRLSRRPSTD